MFSSALILIQFIAVAVRKTREPELRSNIFRHKLGGEEIMYEFKMKYLLLTAVFWISVPGYSVHTSAQTADVNSGEDNLIEEVVVTARKRDEMLFDVPLAVSAISGDDIEALGFANLAETLGSVPGLNIEEYSPGRQTIQLRGASSFSRGDATVGFYIDELPFSNLGQPELPDVATYDLERIEVLRGPQGTLFGASSLGGTVRILTRKPDLENFGLKADVNVASIDDGEWSHSYKAAVNVPLSDELAIRIVGGYEDRGGWIDDPSIASEDINDQELSSGRVKLRWVPNDRLEVNLTALFSRIDSDFTSHSTKDYRMPFGADAVTNGFPFQQVTADYDIYSATIEYDFGPVTLLVAPAYAETENSLYRLFFSDQGSVFQDDLEADIFTTEARLSSNSDGPLHWTLGFFYSDTDQLDTSLGAFAPFGIPQGSLLNLVRGTNKSYAVFGEGSYAFNDKWELTLGLRYFENERTQDDLDTLFVTRALLEAFGFSPFREDKSNTTSPRVNLKWTPTEDMMVYANFARGFRPGRGNFGFQLLYSAFGNVIPEQSIGPETLWSYELGTKFSLLEGDLAFDAALFFNDWTDLQLTVNLPTGGNFTTNIGSAESYGIDLGMTWQTPVEGLSLKMSASIIDTEIIEGSDTLQVSPGIVGDTGLTPGDPIQGLAGETLSIGFNYVKPVELAGLAGNFVTLGQLQYNSDRFFGDHRSDNISTLTLRTGFETENWAVFLFGNNITNEDGAIGFNERQGTFSEYVGIRPRPRQIGINVKYIY